MNTSTHTPGPWTIDETTGVNMQPVYLVESNSGVGLIARVTAKADAALIASAPALLAENEVLRRDRHIARLAVIISSDTWMVLQAERNALLAVLVLLTKKGWTIETRNAVAMAVAKAKEQL